VTILLGLKNAGVMIIIAVVALQAEGNMFDSRCLDDIS